MDHTVVVGLWPSSARDGKIDLINGIVAKAHAPNASSHILVTMRCTHTNLDSNKVAVAKPEGFGDNLVTVCTKMQQQGSKIVAQRSR